MKSQRKSKRRRKRLSGGNLKYFSRNTIQYIRVAVKREEEDMAGGVHNANLPFIIAGYMDAIRAGQFDIANEKDTNKKLAMQNTLTRYNAHVSDLLDRLQAYNLPRPPTHLAGRGKRRSRRRRRSRSRRRRRSRSRRRRRSRSRRRRRSRSRRRRKSRSRRRGK